MITNSFVFEHSVKSCHILIVIELHLYLFHSSTCSINIMCVISRQSRGRLETTPVCAPQRLWIKLRHYYRRPFATGGLFRWTPIGPLCIDWHQAQTVVYACA